MPLRDRFPAAYRLWSTLTGRRARILALVLLTVFLLLSACARISIYMATRRMQAVIAGLSRLEIDKTSEEELVRTVPYLKRSQWDGQVRRRPDTGDIELGASRAYYVSFTNEETWMKYARFINSLGFCSQGARLTKDGYEEGCLLFIPDLLGYRYFSFDASVTLLNGKISGIRYGINDRFVAPHPLGAIVSVRSFHSIWQPYRTGFEVGSLEDENPQFRVGAGEHHLRLEYAYDAPPEMTKHAFQIDLSCFWGLRGCHNAREIAPQLWQDGIAAETAAVARLQSREPCPARIVAGRVRYLPDTGITLVESKGFRLMPLNIEGDLRSETVTDFKLVEILRPPQVASLVGVRGRPFVSFPGDYTKQLLHNEHQWPEAGKQILFFSNMHFDSCQMVPANSEAISAARNTGLAPKREEDETGQSLQ